MSKENREPNIQINGHQLTDSQAMIIRVAIESFASVLLEQGLGDDSHGTVMTEQYLKRITEIRGIIFNS